MDLHMWTCAVVAHGVVNCEFTRRACEPSSLPLVAAVRPLSVTFRDLECGGHFTTTVYHRMPLLMLLPPTAERQSIDESPSTIPHTLWG
ncbi:hypothetical protein AAVH_13341 [Aphelenchoides avenae]|nr:hypothetical protein AAVH_13341 [Aphelenchus avenae]